jgi:predicted esterase
MRRLEVPLFVLLATGCNQASPDHPDHPERTQPKPVAAEAKEAFPRPPPVERAKEPSPGERAEEPLRVEPLDPHGFPPVYVTRGGRPGPAKLVFLHGLCSSGQGYAQSFQESAAKKGTLIAPQGDVLCGKGPASSWSSNVESLNARVVDAFQKLGESGPVEDVTVIGYSQGATRAVALARAYPERYSRLILMGGPERPSPQGLSHLVSVVTMAGERDRQDLMRAGARSFERAGMPATFMVIPEAVHGSMGPNPEKTMDHALDWLFEQKR